LTGVASATVNAGSGNDIVSISMRGVSSVNNYQLTLGTGADIVQLGVGTSAAASAEVAATAHSSRITDFERGNAGDRFEMTDFLNRGLTAYTLNSNAFASGHLRLVQSGTDLLLQSDRDGAGTANGFVTVFTINNGYTGGFTAFNFDGAIGNLTLTGFDSNETIIGATGNDTLSGGGGNDMLYGLAGNDTLNGGDGNDLLDGGLGIDVMTGGLGNDRYVINTLDDQIIEFTGGGVDTVVSSLTYVLGTELENVELSGTASIDATGNDGNNYILGNIGRNTLAGGAGDDTIAMINGFAAFKPGGGTDRVDGGTGNDTLALGGYQSDYQVVTSGDRTFVVSSRSATEVTGVEQASFSNTAPQSWSSLLASSNTFDGLSYIAGNTDLRAGFGANATAGVEHFINFGFAEGRTVTFNALDYIASYSDLRATFGADTAAGATHFINFGAMENRAITFDGWAYLASYGDLIQAFGTNEGAAAQHFIRYGANENREITFNAEAYAAANADLAAAFGTDKEALARHYVAYGFAEGRSLGSSSSGDAAPAPASIATAFVHDSGDVGSVGDAVLFGDASRTSDLDAISNQHILIA
jgi:hypothetical protein